MTYYHMPDFFVFGCDTSNPRSSEVREGYETRDAAIGRAIELLHRNELTDIVVIQVQIAHALVAVLKGEMWHFQNQLEHQYASFETRRMSDGIWPFEITEEQPAAPIIVS